MNAYYVITLPVNKDKTRLNEALSRGLTKGRPHELLHTRFSVDGTKVIVQGEVPQALATHVSGKPYIRYLGRCLSSGQAEQSVYDYLEANNAEWENEEGK